MYLVIIEALDYVELIILEPFRDIAGVETTSPMYYANYYKKVLTLSPFHAQTKHHTEKTNTAPERGVIYL